MFAVVPGKVLFDTKRRSYDRDRVFENRCRRPLARLTAMNGGTFGNLSMMYCRERGQEIDGLLL